MASLISSYRFLDLSFFYFFCSYFFVPIASLAAFVIAIFMCSHTLSIVEALGYSLRFLASLVHIIFVTFFL